MSALAQLTPHAVTEGRTAPLGLVGDQVGYALRELWRSRVVLIFTFVLPLVWLVLIGIIAGNEAVDETTGVRIMQFVTPTAAVMGLLFSAYPPVANSLAQARERKVMKRLRGTPLPIWAYLVGRVGAAVVLAIVAVAVMLAVGVLAYGVQLQWRTMPATVVTLIVGIGCLAALGLAVGSLAPSASTAQSFAIASGVVLSFMSGLFVVGTLPAWMDTVGSLFPVRHLMSPLKDQFNPFLTGSGWDLAALVVMVAWAIGALVVAAWALRREPSAGTATKAAAPEVAARGGELRGATAGRPGPGAMVLDQTRWANTTLMRDAGNVFFGVGMPVGLYALMCSMYADSGFRPNGLPFAFWFAMGMAAYGAGVTAFINMPQSVTEARDRGVLKRLRGTPLAPWQYLAGRTSAAVWISVLTAILTLIVGVAFFHVEIRAEALPLGLGVLLLGTLTIAACGYALVALAPSARAMAMAGLGILLPLAFLSDVFVMGDTPAWMGQFASIFPLRHFVYGLAAALNPGGPTVPWTDIAVMAAWLIGASLVATRFFRWEPRR